MSDGRPLRSRCPVWLSEQQDQIRLTAQPQGSAARFWLWEGRLQPNRHLTDEEERLLSHRQ